MDPRTRDRIVAAFRRKVYADVGFVPFPLQDEWRQAAEGWTLHRDTLPQPGQTYTIVQIPDDTDTTFTAEGRYQRTLHVPRLLTPRPTGPAHQLANLAAFKFGKSYGGAAFLTGFAILPDANVHIVGMEYGICEPEFNYLVEFLCSERGMNMKYRQLLNDKRGGRMRLVLNTGAVYECKSWERKESLKGSKITCYYFAEAYQFPGMICYTSTAQNLRELRGYAVWTTTPDEPWVTYLHDRGHGDDPDWHCSCGADDRCNPYTFDQKARDRDDPDKGGIMTRERFEIAHNGRLGTFIGHVYAYARGDKQASVTTHPAIWREISA